MRTWISRVGIALTISGIAVLAGCSQNEESRSAAPFESEDADANVGSLFGPGVRVCVTNSSSSRMVVNFTQKVDATGEGVVWEGTGRSCGFGDDKSQAWDLRGNFVTTNPDRRWLIQARNPGVGNPGMSLGHTSDTGGFGSFSCFNQGFKVGETKSFDDGLQVVTITRLPDGDSKEFELVVTDSEKGSATGNRSYCPRYQ